jgi:hypothetical protein
MKGAWRTVVIGAVVMGVLGACTCPPTLREKITRGDSTVCSWKRGDTVAVCGVHSGGGVRYDTTGVGEGRSDTTDGGS